MDEESSDPISFDNARIKPLRSMRENDQKKTYTKWINSKLSQVNGFSDRVTDLFTDLSDGTILAALLEALFGFPIPGAKKKLHLKMRIFKVENVGICLNFLKGYVSANLGASLDIIGAEDIVDGCSNLILALVWAIISFQIVQVTGFDAHEQKVRESVTVRLWDQPKKQKVALSGSSGFPSVSESPVVASLHSSSMEEISNNKNTPNPYTTHSSPKEALLSWVNEKTLDSLPAGVNSFEGDAWADGVALKALLLAYGIGDTDDLTDLDRALESAERERGVPKLIDAEDFRTADERSVMTYVAEFKSKVEHRVE